MNTSPTIPEAQIGVGIESSFVFFLAPQIFVDFADAYLRSALEAVIQNLLRKGK